MERKGEELSPEDIVWIAEYEKKFPLGRPKLKRPDLSESEPMKTLSPHSPLSPEESVGGSDVSEPDAAKAAPEEGGTHTPPPINLRGTPQGEKAPPPPGNSPPPPKPEAEETRKKEDAEHSAQCAAMANAYGAWLIASHHKLRDAGAPALPDAMITGLLVPCAYRTAIEFMPKVQSKWADAGVTLIAGGGTFAMVRRLDRQPKPQPGARIFSMPPPQPRANPSPPPPVEKQAPVSPAATAVKEQAKSIEQQMEGIVLPV